MNPILNLLHLKFFCDAVLYKTVSEAAKMNYVSQSAVSQAISKLETVFGAKLVMFNRQKLQLTDEGKVVFDQARHIFKAVQETFDKINQTRDEISGVLKFVTTKSLGMSFIAPTYKQIKLKFPQLHLSFRMGGLNLIRTALKSEEAEFAIVVYDHNFEQFTKHPIQKGRFQLYQSKKIRTEPSGQCIFVDDMGGMYVKELKDFLGDNPDYSTKILSQTAGWELTARFTELGLGIGFFPDYIVSNNRYPDIKEHPLDIPPFEYEICVIFNKGARLSHTARAFLDQFTLEI